MNSSRQQVLGFRLAGHHLAQRRPVDALVPVVGACGLRNTPPGSAEGAAWARLDGLAPGDVARSIEGGQLVEILSVRISPLVVPRGEMDLFTTGAVPREEASLRAVLSNLTAGLDAAGITAGEAVDLAVAAARDELQDGPSSKSVLSAGMTRRLPPALSVDCRACGSTHVGESLFRLAGVRGAFVIAPRSGKTVHYVRPDREPALEAEAARDALLRRYLRCFGPSTAEHFAGWAGISRDEARADWRRLGGQLEAVTVDGQPAWVHADDVAALGAARLPHGVRLLPPYDAYLDAGDRVLLLPDRTAHRRVWKTLGNPGVVLVDGEVTGIWRTQKRGKRLILTVEPFGELSAGQRESIGEEASALAPFRGCAAVETIFA